MKLADLNPEWITGADATDDAKLGIRFDSPTNAERKIAIFFMNPIGGGAAVDIDELLRVQRDCDHPRYQQWLHGHHVGSVLWKRMGETFDDLTLLPSIDCSEWGGWHGCITNGQAN